jgi:hypothetical protein
MEDNSVKKLVEVQIPDFNSVERIRDITSMKQQRFRSITIKGATASSFATASHGEGEFIDVEVCTDLQCKSIMWGYLTRSSCKYLEGFLNT